MKDDPMGAGYNVNQARIAIGSGRFWGKGFLQGTQTKLKFVPEQDTDFIFCTVGEEWGFFGSSIVLLIYLYFILHLLTIAERQRDTFSRIFGYSVVGMRATDVVNDTMERYRSMGGVRRRFISGKKVTKWQTYIKELDQIMNIVEVRMETLYGEDWNLFVLKKNKNKKKDS